MRTHCRNRWASGAHRTRNARRWLAAAVVLAVQLALPAPAIAPCGADTVDVVDGAPGDTVTCALGNDTVYFDAGDQVSANCNTRNPGGSA